MEERFNQIKNIRFEIKDSFAKLTAKKDTVRGYYIQYIEKNKKNKMFGLDSFHFQSKLIDLEYKHLNEHYIFIDNRIYCDYYKLYNILIAFYKQNFKTDFKHRNYPIYKDLEPFKQYDFDDINNIHYDIIEMIQHAYGLISQNNEEIKTDQQKLKSGFNIDNYIHNHIYKNTILLTNVKLYENYLNSYHIYHMDFLKNLFEKIGLFKNQLSETVRTDGVTPIDSRDTTPSSRSLDRVISVDDEDIKIIIDRSMPRPSEPILEKKNETIVEKKNETVGEKKDEMVEVIKVEVIEEVVNEVTELINIGVKEENEEVVVETDDFTKKEIPEETNEIINEIIIKEEEIVEKDVVEIVEEPMVETVIDNVEQPIAESIPEEVEEPVVEPMIETVVKPVVETIVEPVVETVAESIPEEVEEAVVETVVEPVVEKVVEPVVETIEEPVVETIEEPVVNPIVESMIQNNSRGVDPNDIKTDAKKKKNKKRR
jgi:hypothetical protein